MSMTVNSRYFTFRAVWILFFIVRYDGIEGTLCDVDVFLSEEELAMYLDDAGTRERKRETIVSV